VGAITGLRKGSKEKKERERFTKMLTRKKTGNACGIPLKASWGQEGIACPQQTRAAGSANKGKKKQKHLKVWMAVLRS